MASFNLVDNPEIWSYDGTLFRVRINGEWYPRCTTAAIHKGLRLEEHWRFETYRAQLLHYGLEDTFNYETARQRLRIETEKHLTPKTVSTIETGMTIPPELQELESHLTAL
jgi:hypothetical protein